MPNVIDFHSLVSEIGHDDGCPYYVFIYAHRAQSAKRAQRAISVQYGIQAAYGFSQFTDPPPSCFSLLVFPLPKFPSALLPNCTLLASRKAGRGGK